MGDGRRRGDGRSRADERRRRLVVTFIVALLVTTAVAGPLAVTALRVRSEGTPELSEPSEP